MICLYSNKATNEDLLKDNGLYILDKITTYANIHEVLNGAYELDLNLLVDRNEQLINKEVYDLLSEDYIIRVDDEEGEEFFRIASVDKSSNKTIKIYARHISISDTLNMWLEDVRPTDTGGQGALSHIFTNAKGGNRFTVLSNISTKSTAYYQNKNVYQALCDGDNCFLSRWGGEIKRRGFNLTINDKIGTDRGFSIRSRKNLQGFNVKTNIDTIATTLYVKGYDGIALDTPVVSPLVNKYSKPMYREVIYDDIMVKSANNPDEGFDTLEEAQAEMRKRAEAEFSVNNIDKIKATFDLNYYDLSKCEEYKEYGITEKAFLGDTITVFEDTYNINVKVRLIERNYDPVLKVRVNSILSNEEVKNNSITVDSILTELEKQVEKNPSLSSYIDSMMKAGLKNSYVINRENEFIVADNKDLNLALNVIRINKNGLGFSQTGYNGTYEYGFTIDGKINASLIATGILSTILITNADGSFQIDLSGTGGAIFKTNGKNAIEIVKNKINFFNWSKEGDPVGSIGSLVQQDNQIPSLGLYHDSDSTLYLGYQREGSNSVHVYMEFDINKLKNHDKPIYVQYDTFFGGGITTTEINNRLPYTNGIYFRPFDTVVKGDLLVQGIIKNGTGQIRAEGVEQGVEIENGVKIYNVEGTEVIYPTDEEPKELITQARRLIGLPYSQDYFNYYTNDIPPYCDCSSLCQWSYYQIGKRISRTTYTQINEGVEVAQGKAQPGDLVFSNFSSPGVPEHVFLYSKYENGQHYCIEASTWGVPCKERTFTFTGTMRVRRLLNVSNNDVLEYATKDEVETLKDEIETLKGMVKNNAN